MKNNQNGHIWKNRDHVSRYIEDVRGAIPYAVGQIEIMLEAIAANTSNVKNFADIGCGNGILSGAILHKYPDACGTAVDFYEPVLEESKYQLIDYISNLNFIVSDLMDPGWVNSIKKNVPFDVIVSGYAIHHLSNKRKKEVYAEIFKMLRAGGIFVNIERVLPEGAFIGKIARDQIVESVREYNKKKGILKTSKEIIKEYSEFISSKADVLAPADVQMKWLKEIGFEEVGMFFKVYTQVVFGGIKPKKK